MNNVNLSIMLILIAVGLFLLHRKGYIGDVILGPLANIATVVALIAAILLLMFPVGPNPNTVETFKVVVMADREWQDSGVFVQEGEYLQISYLKGQWSQCAAYGCPYFSADGEDFDTPEDNVTGRCHDSELIGRISGGEPFCVGAQFASNVPNTGKLDLRMNDASVADNGGNISVQIEIRK